MPTARSVREGEVDRAGEVGALAFEGELQEWRDSFQRQVDDHGHDSVIVVEHEGKIVSSMLAVPEGMRLGETTVPAVAVAGVGTVPEARKIGCAATMMTEAVHRMRAWGAAASPMWPFSFVYYRKFGWEIGGEARVVTWKRETAWQIEPRGEISGVTPEDAADIAAVWEAVGARHRGATAAADRDFEFRLRRRAETEGRDGVVCRHEGRPTGYALYTMPEPKDGEGPGPVEVVEIRAVDPAAEVAVLVALSERVEAAAFRASFAMDSRLRSIAVNPRDLETEMPTSFGFRVIDPAAIFATMRTDQALPPVRIHVEDEILGAATWEVGFDGGPAEARKTSTQWDVACSIQTFSQIASGFLKPAEAARAGLLTGDHAAALRLDAATGHWTLPLRTAMERG